MSEAKRVALREILGAFDSSEEFLKTKGHATMPAKAKMMAKDRIHQQLCEKFKKRRLALGLTQKEVGDRLGIDQPSYSAIENGKASPSWHQIDRVSKALEMRASIRLVEA